MQLSKFQVAILIIFGLFIVGGVIAFSVYKGSGKQTVELSVWGTLPSSTWNAWYSSSPISQNRLYQITYTDIPEETFDGELVNAIAENRGPDIIITYHDKALKNQTKLYTIPFTSFSKRDFQNTFLDVASVLTGPNGIVAIPILVDPLVLYYNKDIFANFSLVKAPSLWEQMYPLSQAVTIRDQKTGNIKQSTIALGSSSNVLHAKEILVTMIMQAGGAVVTDTEKFIRSTLSESFSKAYSPANSALLFFTEFSNPTKAFYTWNRSMPDSLSEFAAGDSALFVGFASDYKRIKDKNPNLPFDVAFLPQSTSATRFITLGKMITLSVPRGTEKWASAFGAIFEMMTPQSVFSVSELLKLPPSRRDLYSSRPADPFQALFYDSAIKTVSFKDPDLDATDVIFKNMIDSVTSGKVRVEDAVVTADKELQSLINRYVSN